MGNCCSTRSDFQRLPKMQGANVSFYEDYGSPQLPESWLSQSKLIMVRQAECKEDEFFRDAQE